MNARIVALAVAVSLAGFLAGCHQSSVEESKQQAFDSWGRERGKVFARMASEHYKYGQVDEAYAKAAEAHKLDEENLDHHLLYCQLMMEKGQFKAAQSELEALRDKYPRNGTIHYLLGVANERQNKLNEALACYKLAVRFDTGSSGPVLAVAETLIAMGQVDQAEQFMHDNLNEADQTAGVHELAGRLAMMQGKYVKAATSFGQAWSLNRKCDAYLEMMAQAYLAADQPVDALKALDKLTGDPEFTPSVAVAMLQGDVACCLGQYDRAMTHYRSALKLDENNLPAWVALARASLSAGQSSDAIRAAGMARAIDHENLDAALVMGYALLKQNQPRRALKVLHAVQKAHPKAPMLHTLLGKAYSQAGDAARAKQCYRYALWLEPDHKAALALQAAG
jgi:tetratricopeptide (TPR) repeat protein